MFITYLFPGGNAGYAAAYAAKQLGVPATIVLPGSTPEFVADDLRDINANVLRHGQVWHFLICDTLFIIHGCLSFKLIYVGYEHNHKNGWTVRSAIEMFYDFFSLHESGIFV